MDIDVFKDVWKFTIRDWNFGNEFMKFSALEFQ